MLHAFSYKAFIQLCENIVQFITCLFPDGSIIIQHTKDLDSVSVLPSFSTTKIHHYPAYQGFRQNFNDYCYCLPEIHHYPAYQGFRHQTRLNLIWLTMRSIIIQHTKDLDTMTLLDTSASVDPSLSSIPRI